MMRIHIEKIGMSFAHFDNLLAFKDLQNAHLAHYACEKDQSRVNGQDSGPKTSTRRLHSHLSIFHIHSFINRSLVGRCGEVTGMQIDLMCCQLKCAINFIWLASHYRICNWMGLGERPHTCTVPR